MSFARYAEYRDSAVEWLGAVPAHWEVLPLKRRFDVVGGSTPKSEDDRYWDGDVPWATPADLSGLTSMYIRETGRRITAMGLASCGTNLVAAGSIILSTRAPIGSLAIASVPMCTNQGCKSLVPRTAVDVRYFAWLLQVNTAALNVRGRGTTFLELSGDELGSFEVPVPTMEEQGTIVAFLDRETAKIDALVGEQERLIELLKDKRQAVISHAVTKGLNPSAPMKDSGVQGIGRIPKHWDLRRVKVLSSFVTSGPRGWSENISDGGARFVQSGDLDDDMNVDFDGAARVSVADDAEAARTRLYPGDVVVCITGAKTGNVAVCDSVPEDAYINQHLCLIRPSKSVLPRYLATVLKSGVGKTYFEVSQYGLKQGLSLEDVRDAPIPVPSLDEQREILDQLSSRARTTTALLSECISAIDLLQERRAALISAAVTGQIDVRSAAERSAA